MSFNYALRRVGDVVVLDLSGRLVFGQGAPHTLRELVREQIEQGSKNILINLREVNYTDTGGLGAMVAVLATVTNHGCTLRFCEAKGSVLEVLRMTRLDSVLKVSDDETTAIGAFSTKHLRKSSVA
jgi:anti-sigma B factor antagonist